MNFIRVLLTLLLSLLLRYNYGSSMHLDKFYKWKSNFNVHYVKAGNGPKLLLLPGLLE